MGFLDLFKDLSFLLKFIAMIVNIVILVMWTVPDRLNIPAGSFGATVLFYHAHCAYMIILVGFVLLYILDEPPGQWALRIFIATGAILFLVSGIIGLIYTLIDDKGTSHQLVVAILLTVNGVLLAIDFIKSENFC